MAIAKKPHTVRISAVDRGLVGWMLVGVADLVLLNDVFLDPIQGGKIPARSEKMPTSINSKAPLVDGIF